MKNSFDIKGLMRNGLLIAGLALTLLAGSAFAQVGGATSTTQTAPATSSSSSNTTKATTTTSTRATEPVQTTQPAQSTRVVETRTTTVDPLWIAIGGVALLAILIIAILSMRGRSGDRVVSVEKETVIRR